jgi:hypothetical protein
MSVNGTYRAVASSRLFTPGSNWVHVTLTYDQTTLRLYLDGADDAHADYPGSISYNMSNRDLHIGDWGMSGYERRFHGAVDDVRVYSRALSASEVAALAVVNADANTNGMPDAWEATNFGSTNAVEGGAQDDYDHDGMNNLAEYIAGTSPTNAADVLKIAEVTPDGLSTTGMVLRWSSVAGRWYAIQTATNLMTGFDGWAKTNIPATPAMNTHTVIVDQIRNRYYRVTVEE